VVHRQLERLAGCQDSGSGAVSNPSPASGVLECGLCVRAPLVVDLDGTLIRSDLLIETALCFLSEHPFSSFKLLWWLAKGKATLKQNLARTVTLDVATLPYNDVVLDRLRKAKSEGRATYLASASDERLVQAVAAHLGLFDGWFASDGKLNLSGDAKAALLVDRFGERGFHYIGNSLKDVAVWARAASAVALCSSKRVVRRAVGVCGTVEQLSPPTHQLSAWIRLLRPHQWAKNLLVAVPVLTAHQFTPGALVNGALALVAFSICASSVYVLNDLIDIQADRAHPTKNRRPFASGEISISQGALLIPLLLTLASLIAWCVSPFFAGVLGIYYLMTNAYSFILKRKMMIDVVTLAGLYTARVVGGMVAIDVPISEWLLGFSMFMFLSLALIKRHSEMAARLDAGLPDPSNRNYKVGDLPVIISLGAAAGYSAVIVFSLYLSSDTVRILYSKPRVLWLACPLLLYWISRVLLLSHRRVLDDDPVVFALRDRVSLATAALMVGLVAAAA
jgi:4-hydroxybenzoate polyprenyltransferase